MDKEFTKLVAELLLRCAEEYRKDNNQKSQLTKIMKEIIRKHDDTKTPMVSKKAAALFPEIDLTQKKYKDQGKFDPRRKKLTFEHMDTINETVSKAFKIDNVKEMIGLIEKTRIVWVTKDEDGMLRRKKYTSKRPDPDKAYEECGIEVLSANNH